MKRFFIWFCLLFVPSIMLFPDTIHVVQPNGGEIWTCGKTVAIVWTSSGIGNTVKIALRKGNTTVTPHIDDNAPNTGIYHYPIPNNLAPGSDYKIAVANVTETVYDLSDGHFTIKPAPAANITVYSPKGGEHWVMGNTYNIVWGSDGISGNVKIILKKGGATVKTISNSAPNIGTFSWSTGIQAPGSDYKIRIENSAGAIFDESDKNFSIRVQMALVKARPVIESAFTVPLGPLKGGNKLYLKGRHFGTPRGKIRMVGNFYHEYNREIDFVDVNWVSSTEVNGVVPTFDFGQQDQTVKIKVLRADNEISDPWEVRFEGRKETHALTAWWVDVVKCGRDANSNGCLHEGDYRMNPEDSTIYGGHSNNWGTVGNDVGDDQYMISLRHGWVFKSMEILEWHKSSRDEVLTGPHPPLPEGESLWAPTIHWKVSPNDEVRYRIKIVIEGPAGTLWY